MSRWLALARDDAEPKGQDRSPQRPFGTNGTIGTAPETELDAPPPAPIGTIGANGTASLVSPEEVRALFELTVNRLASDLGRPQDVAIRDALPIVRASLRNDPRLAPDQPDAHRCLICGNRDAPLEGNPLLPFLSAVVGNHHWIHSGGGCHSEHCRRQAEKADNCLRVAGLLSIEEEPRCA